MTLSSMPTPDEPSRADGRRGLMAVAAALLVLIGGATLFGANIMAVRSAPAAPALELPPAAAPGPIAAAAAPAMPPIETASVLPGRAPRPAAPTAEAPRAHAEAAPPRQPQPRLKSASGPTAASAGPSLIPLGQRFLLALDEERPPFYFADEAPGAAPPPAPIALALAGDVVGDPAELRLAVRKGETLVDLLARAGIRADDRNAAAAALGAEYDLRRLRPGQVMRVTSAAPNRTLFQIVAEGHEPLAHLIALEFAPDSGNRIDLRRHANGSFAAARTLARTTLRLASVNGRIDGSLYHSAKRIGAPDKVVADLAAIFAYDIDFQREVFGGDEFEAVFEARYDENGRLVEAGEILFGRMKWKGRQKEKAYYRFAAAELGGKADYFDARGESAKRLLMKTPIDGARLSSGFGMRRHPISGFTKQHKGVDFAAAHGTPIKAAGDGVVERADRFGGYGNYVRIRHGQGYKTAYAHLSRFAKGVRAGARVEQGQIIGYVGSTGASTGPHLHYEVLEGARHVNPQNLKVSTGVTLAGAELQRFKLARENLDQMRAAAAPEAPLLANDEAASKQL